MHTVANKVHFLESVCTESADKGWALMLFDGGMK